MRIAMSTKTVMTPTGQRIQFDGIGVYTYYLMHALATQGVEIENLYFRSLKAGPRPTAMTSMCYCAMHPLYSHHLPFNCYQKIEDQVDLIHVTDYRMPKLRRRPLVVTLHDAIMFKHPQWVSPRLRWLKNTLLKKSAKQADHVVTVSQTMRADMINYWGIAEEKISVVYNGISRDWLQPVSVETCAEVIDRYQLPSNYLLFVGTLQQRKNIERILDAYLQLPALLRQEMKLLIVGQLHPGLTPPGLIARLQHCQERGEVRWLSWLPFKSLRVLYQGASALLYPSLEEGFGLPILEGFAVGIPVISSNEGAMAEVAGGAAYLVDPRSTEAISAAMVAVSNEAVKLELIAKGRSRVRDFSWQRCAQRMISVYNRLI